MLSRAGEANIADWPSRGELAFAADLRADMPVLELPPSGRWGSVAAALKRARVDDADQDPPIKRSRPTRRGGGRGRRGGAGAVEAGVSGLTGD